MSIYDINILIQGRIIFIILSIFSIMKIKASGLITLIYLSFNLAVFSVEAQTDITTQYIKAKELIRAEKFDESIKILSELANTGENVDFTATCRYLTAYAYYKKNNLRDANFLLFQIISKNQSWDNIDMAYYLKGVVQLESKSYMDALTQFSKISGKALRKKADDALVFYSDRITTDSLIMLNQRFKEDKGLKMAYTKRTSTYKDAEISTKPEYNVALLLPIELLAKNRFVYELNAGINLAVDSLSKMGIKINIHPFDTGKDTISLKNFVSKDNTNCFDLIIGPLYNNQQKIINEFSKKNDIPVVNPLANTFAQGNQNPNYFLFQPSVETQGTMAAEFAFKNFTRKPTAIIVFGATATDSLIAKAYKLQFEKSGGKVLKFKKLTKSNASYFGSLFNKLPIDSVGHVFISSTESALAANVFTTLEGFLIEKAASYKETLINNMLQEVKEERKLTVQDIPVFTSAKWLDFESISYEQFMMHNTHFFQPEFAIKDLNATNFENKYFETYQIPASNYAKQGYSLMLNFGIYLHSFGIYFPKFLSETLVQKTATMSYHNFSNSRDNAFLPILKIDNYSLLLVNKPEIIDVK